MFYLKSTDQFLSRPGEQPYTGDDLHLIIFMLDLLTSFCLFLSKPLPFSQEHLLFSCHLSLELHIWTQFIVVMGTGLYISETGRIFCIFFLLVCVRLKIWKAATESSERNLKIPRKKLLSESHSLSKHLISFAFNFKLIT